MLSLPDQALKIKHIYQKEDSTTGSSRKFDTVKTLKTRKSPVLCSGILKFFLRYEKLGYLL